MKILYVAEIVGKAGIACCKRVIANLRRERGIDFVIACADGATNGNGLGRGHAAYLHKLGIDVLTTGDCAFYKTDLTEAIDKIPYVLRPDNFVPGAPGFGSRVYKTNDFKIGVGVLLGQSFNNKIHGDSPFYRLPVLLERLHAETPFVLIDFHAAATAEKITLFHAGRGKVSAIIGSHTRIQTADEAVWDGTATLTCAGRTGSINSVGGCDIESRIREYLTGVPDWTRPAWDNCELQGALVDILPDGRASSIERLKIPVPDITPDS